MAYSADHRAPGLFSVLFGAVLSLVLGALLALVHLASLPVEVLKTEPKEDAPVEGRKIVLGAPGSTAGVAWERKRETLGGGAVTFTEAELNAWSAATFTAAKLEEGQKGSTVVILAGEPNFRVVGSHLQIALVNTLHFFGSEAPVVLHGRGEFAKEGSRWKFVPVEAYLGGLPLHRVPALLPLVAARFGANQRPAEVEKVLAQASEIAVRDGALSITMP